MAKTRFLLFGQQGPPKMVAKRLRVNTERHSNFIILQIGKKKFGWSKSHIKYKNTSPKKKKAPVSNEPET